MLCLSLALSILLLLTAHLAAIRKRWLLPLTASAFVGCGVALTFGPAWRGLFFSPPVLLQFLLLGLALLFLHTRRQVNRPFWQLSAGATLIAYALPCLFALATCAEDEDLARRRQVDAMEGEAESLVARLPERRLYPQNGSLSPATASWPISRNQWIGPSPSNRPPNCGQCIPRPCSGS